MIVVFVHGWSVTDTSTYGALPEALQNAAAAAGEAIDLRQIHLGRYVSFHDEIELADIARAFDQALRDAVPDALAAGTAIGCVTHSTGGPVVRTWVDRFYAARGALDACPIKHLVMLAPANHGSALAVLGKARVGRIKAWFNDIEPGRRVLNWLELGSAGQWALNGATSGYDFVGNGFYPFVITGQNVDRRWYDHLNSYTGEVGSDGVVRVAGANLNYEMVKLVQTDTAVPPAGDSDPDGNAPPATPTALVPEALRLPPESGMAILPDTSHTGPRMGIMQAIGAGDTTAPVVTEVLACLRVDGADAYAARVAEMAAVTAATQNADDANKTDGRPDRYSMLVFRVSDDQGRPLEDFDIYMLSGDAFNRGGLPGGFFKDRQKNTISPNTITYYVNEAMLEKAQRDTFGLEVVARPGPGNFSYYRPAIWRNTDTGIEVRDVVRPNQTTYIDVVLKRRIDRNTFRIDPPGVAYGDFSGIAPDAGEITG